MTKKYSSFKEQQILQENFRKFIKEGDFSPDLEETSQAQDRLGSEDSRNPDVLANAIADALTDVSNGQLNLIGLFGQPIGSGGYVPEKLAAMAGGMRPREQQQFVKLGLENAGNILSRLKYEGQMTFPDLEGIGSGNDFTLEWIDAIDTWDTNVGPGEKAVKTGSEPGIKLVR